ncbi:MAG: hypothetical protein AAB372_01380 [Patescibacteria group bacterium]
MFIGQYENRVDKKGRVVFPAAFRERCRGSVFLWWHRNVLKIYCELPVITSKEAPFVIEIQIDSQGRILLPERQRKFLAIEFGDTLIFSGRLTHIEVARQS